MARELNFRSSRRFLALAEEDLAALVLRARRGADGSSESSRFLLTFPPLQPKFAQLLHALLVRFDLTFAVQGWGDERRLTAEATRSKGLLPALRCEHFLAAAGLPEFPGSLAAVAASEVEATDAAGVPEEAKRAEEEEDAFVPEHDDREKAAPATPVKRKRGRQGYSGGGGGMRGWSSEEESDPEPARASKADARRAPKGKEATQRVTRGRGFLSEAEQAASAAKTQADEDLPIRCRLRGDYEHYAIDPEDTWRPHRKPYVELLSEGWEFSHAWSFEPEHNPNRPPPPRGDPGGVGTWRVEHAAERYFAVALGGQSQDMRRWLSGRSGAGEEPYVLEFRLAEEERRWDYRFARVAKLSSATWRPLAWSCDRHTVFWLACFVGREDGKNYLQAGLDIFPEKRFFSARLASFPKMMGFGLPAGAPGPFFVRDVVLFGRGALRPAPFAGRDHLVEVPLTRREAEKALRKERLSGEVLALTAETDDKEKENKENPPGKTPWRKMFSDGILEPPAEKPVKPEESEAPMPCCLVVCESSDRATAAAEKLKGQVIPGLPKTWPPQDAGSNGVEAAKQILETQEKVWQSLRSETVREVGLFKEHLARGTRHLEGTRIARSAAMRMIISGLSGAAPLPNPPRAGV